mmetsp:Transcript_9953/g.17617  ORF Transcript_9953/g.17617 Transcript_9953/m.17617 type:complete len:83 (+) Transcript_9953:1070-1318(+)|eukprot:CAMPEP_0178794286 /NCGR_PEP_ID=MMETSP0745-20121128/9508_1 /TAXON_ID=913974 /ORGANISM="Nitzschia punctata, Strain CCMP561" /LENGTH=82 /DNA_ID=CAMNT_0020452595 /DNA_START=1738 /DNA_END=1986 /DNA_ORIENTATION=-
MAHATANPYRLWYQDAANDPHHGNYNDVFAAFNDPNQQPATIRNLVFGTGNQDMPVAIIALTREPQAPPNVPGSIPLVRPGH